MYKKYLAKKGILLNTRLTTTNKDAKLALLKAKNFVNITSDILTKQNTITKQNNVINFSDNFEVWIDTNTNLMWELKTVENIEDIYSYNDSVAYVNNLNQIKYAGFEDWRRPTINELKSISSPKLTNDLYIIKQLVSNSDWAYWSNTNSENNDKLFVFYFNDGYKRSESINFKCSIRCVRDSK